MVGGIEWPVRKLNWGDGLKNMQLMTGSRPKVNFEHGAYESDAPHWTLSHILPLVHVYTTFTQLPASSKARHSSSITLIGD